MKKIIKYVCMVIVAGLLISKVMEIYEDYERNERRQEQLTHRDPSMSIGGKMVRNVLEDNNDEILPGDDAEPLLGEPYTDIDGEEWIFAESLNGGIQVTFKKNGSRTYTLEKIGTGVYNTYFTDKYASAGYIIRMIDEGRAIEVQQGKGERKKKAIFKAATSTL
jgi:hypothetical protein